MPRDIPCGDNRTDEGRMSAGNLAGLLSGRKADPMAYRRCFRDRWGAFLRAHFQSPLHVAVFFDVDESTARKWWSDINEPSGWVVAFAVKTVPGAQAALVGIAA